MSASRFRLRRLWFRLHQWIGIGLGLILVVIGVSGSLLVWHDDLDALVNPGRYATNGIETLAPSAYLQSASANLPDSGTLTSLRMPGEEGSPVLVTARVETASGRPRNVTVWLDPASAKVLEIGDAQSGLVRVLHTLHGSLRIPEVGRQIVGWFGVAMLISSLTGIWLWWPRNGEWRRAFRWRRGPSTTDHLHHTAGIWIAIPLAVLCFTGVYISFPQTGRSVLGEVSTLTPPQPRPPQNAAPVASPALQADAVLAIADAAMVDEEFTALFLPTRAGDDAPALWRVQFRDPATDTNATVQIDDATGAVVATSPPAQDGDVVQRWIRRIHDGNGTGPVWQVIVFLGGVLPALFLVTGVLMWLTRRRYRRAMTRRLEEAPAAGD